MFKKLLSVLLAAALSLSLIGCGSNLDTAIEILEMADEIVEAVDNAASEAGSNSDHTPGNIIIDLPAQEEDTGYDQPEEILSPIDEDGTYNSVEDVSLYLYTYGCLPSNYITKNDARDLGWSGGSVEDYAGEGYAIGGDKFGNREGLLPKADGRQYYECDIDTVGGDERGTKRIVWSNDGLIYYTPDHYKTFTLLYGEE